jgi:peptide/nickel transport system permease protein
MPEPSRSAATEQIEEPTAPVGGSTDLDFDGEPDRVDAIEEVELSGTHFPAAAVLSTSEPPKTRRKLGPFFWLAVGWLVVLVLLAVLAPVLPFVDSPKEFFPDAFRTSPSAEHWFGGDAIGRDLFARVVYGARVSLTVGVAAIAIGLAVGGTLGLIAGYFRGTIDTVITSVANILLAFPALILALALVSFMGQNLRNVILALAILSIPRLIRITRAATLTFSQREFVMASRTLGASHWRVITREVLPNVVPPMLSFSLLAIAVVIVAEGALSFLGLSVEAPTASWGGIINEGRDLLDEAPHISLIPCGVMFVTLLSLNYVGDKLRAAWDVRLGVPASAGARSATSTRIPAPGPSSRSRTSRPTSPLRRGSPGWSTACRSPSSGAGPSASWASPARGRRSCPAPSSTCCPRTPSGAAA